MKIVLALRALLLLILLPLITLVFSIVVILVIIPFATRSTMDLVIRIWAHTLCGISGVRVHVEGREHVKNLKSALFVSNHQSHFDIPVLFIAIPNSFRMAAKKELFYFPVFGQALSKAGFMALDRKRVETSQHAMEKMKEQFGDGDSFWMAPEGTRFDGEGIGDFKSGAFHLAIQTGQPIVPVCVFGTHKVLSKRSFLTNKKQWLQDVYVQILPPVKTADLTMAARFELRNAVREKIVLAYSRHQQDSSVSQNLQTLG